MLGFAGVLLVIKPATGEFSAPALIPVIAALFYAIAAIITRAKCARETPMSLALALNFALLLVGAMATAAILVWRPSAAQTEVYTFLLGYWIAMGAYEWGVIALLAMLMVAISIGLARAYQSAPAAIIATFDYSYLIFAGVFGFVMFSEVPDGLTVIGMMLIAAAGLLVVRRSAARS